MTRYVAIRAFNVLFLCQTNTARSVIAESVMNRVGLGRFNAFSAGSTPGREVSPETIAVLHRAGYSVEHASPRDWLEFAWPGAVPLDFVIGLCGRPLGRHSPAWRGRPCVAHWNIPAPEHARGTPAERSLVFVDVYRMIATRIEILASLPDGLLQGLADRGFAHSAPGIRRRTGLSRPGADRGRSSADAGVRLDRTTA